ncbi:MAG: M24 family metallopeptidase [Variibacter sp.]
MSAKPAYSLRHLPFDQARLDRIMDDAGVDVVIANAKHNVQYLLGGHRAQFFDYMDAIGPSRYLPLVIYPKGAPERAAFIGHRLEGWQQEVAPFWTPEAQTSSAGSVDAMEKAIAYLRRSGIKTKNIAIEMSFLPIDAGGTLYNAFSSSKFSDAHNILERLRAVKRPEELDKLRIASEKVIEAMLAVIATHDPGSTKQELTDALRREEINRGLNFEYCLVAVGASHNRAPSSQRWESGEVLSIDSGGNYYGYIGDLARMAIQGSPDDELQDLLNEVEEIQRAAFAPVKAGALGQEIYAAAEARLRRSPQHAHIHFVAHGMGLASHEAPRLAPGAQGEHYGAAPLETGMVISVETTIRHPRRGYIKLEDTVAVTPSGFEIFGEGARGWNIAGTA